MIAATRAYIEARIKQCDSDYKRIDDPIGDNAAAMSQLDKRFKIYFSQLSPSIDGNFYTDQVDATVEIYKKAGHNETDDFDSLYDLAIGIKNTIMEPLSVKNSDAFSDITPNSISPEPLPTNDRVFKMVMSFTIRKDFDYQGV